MRQPAFCARCDGSSNCYSACDLGPIKLCVTRRSKLGELRRSSETVPSPAGLSISRWADAAGRFLLPGFQKRGSAETQLRARPGERVALRVGRVDVHKPNAEFDILREASSRVSCQSAARRTESGSLNTVVSSLSAWHSPGLKGLGTEIHLFLSAALLARQTSAFHSQPPLLSRHADVEFPR